MKRFRHYIINGSSKQEVFTPAPKTFDVYKNDESDSDDTNAANNETAIEEKANEVQKKLKMTPNENARKNDVDDVERVASSSSLNKDGNPQAEIPTTTGSRSDNQPPKKVPNPGTGPDPNKPKCRKAKDVRKERALKKLEAKGVFLFVLFFTFIFS